MSQAFYRQYRPKKLNEVVGQEHITDTLSSALKQGKISHAYLFTGPRGVGKTSIARILAHEVNNLAYTDESIHLDIIEIDAASNRRIDEIRDIREKVHITPTSANYKVYIIDEVHMLTKEAFNALLKTLEEPPKHVIFILATTEVHKLPETIISRTQRHTFRPVDYAKVVEHLRFIANKENITIDDEALQIIAEHGEGSFRDSISLLDQSAGINENITTNTILELLGTPPQELISKLIACLKSDNSVDLLKTIDKLKDRGSNAGSIAKQLLIQLRASMLQGNPLLTKDTHTKLSEKLIEVTSSAHPYTTLELALISSLPGDNLIFVPQKNEVIEEKHNESITKKSSEVSIDSEQTELISIDKPLEAKKPLVVDMPEELIEIPKTEPSINEDVRFDDSLWQAVLQSVKKTHNTLYTVLRITTPKIVGDTFIIGCKFGFHQKQLNLPKNKAIISEVIALESGNSYTISIIVETNDALTQVGPANIKTVDKIAKDSTPAESSLDIVKDIFGGGEVIS